MSHFPGPITLPDCVNSARQERGRQLVSSATQGIFIRVSIIIAELIGVYFFASSALLMDAVSSLLDISFTLCLIFFIKLANKPPDTNHPFGHGRYEPLVGLQLGLALAFIGGSVIFQQSAKIASNTSDEVLSPYAWIIPFFAVVLLEICYRRVMRTAKKQNSPALAADAVHYRIDGLTSLFAASALLLAAYFPEQSILIDHMGAIVIALLMIVVGLYAARNNLNQLLDRVPSREYFERVKESSLKVKGVLGTEKIRIQHYGPDAQVDIDIEVDPKMSVEEAHTISQLVRSQIQLDWPMVRDVIVHIEPYYPNDH